MRILPYQLQHGAVDLLQKICELLRSFLFFVFRFFLDRTVSSIRHVNLILILVTYLSHSWCNDIRYGLCGITHTKPQQPCIRMFSHMLWLALDDLHARNKYFLREKIFLPKISQPKQKNTLKKWKNEKNNLRKQISTLQVRHVRVPWYFCAMSCYYITSIIPCLWSSKSLETHIIKLSVYVIVQIAHLVSSECRVLNCSWKREKKKRKKKSCI